MYLLTQTECTSNVISLSLNVNCGEHSLLVAPGELLWSCLGFMAVPAQYRNSKELSLVYILHLETGISYI